MTETVDNAQAGTKAGSRKRTILRLCVTTLLIAAAVSITYFWLAGRRPPTDVTVIPEPKIASSGPLPLTRLQACTTSWGYPVGEGQALFWFETRGAVKERILVRLPDWHVLCRVKGFDGMIWGNYGEVIGVKAHLRPFRSLVPLINRFYRRSTGSNLTSSYSATYWTIDYRTGEIARSDGRILPTDRYVGDISGTDGILIAPMVLAGVPPALQAGMNYYQTGWDPQTNKPALKSYNLQTGAKSVVCDVDIDLQRGDHWFPSIAGKDKVFILLFRATKVAWPTNEIYLLTPSTGKLEKIPWPNETGGAAK